MTLFVIFLLLPSLYAQQPVASIPAECAEMETWDFATAMCMPVAMPGMPMQMLMLHGNAFAVQTSEEGRRGKNALYIPNMFMSDVGTTWGGRHYLNLDFMGTVERWSFPAAGEPELLQIGEENSAHQPYIDAQHPHSSPVMGLTLSDTISFSERNYLKIWVAPRGQSTDGPVAFMHRPTGMVNPDAPLGHHIGQDVGHISSTVVGASVHYARSTFELSTFNGTEPEPYKVDLPIAKPNSFAARLTTEWARPLYSMISLAYVKNPEPEDPETDHIWRYSASVYYDRPQSEGWATHGVLIWGLVNFYDQTSALNSFLGEFSLEHKKHNIWGRVEVLQRTPGELEIPHQPEGEAYWVTSLTLGYTRDLCRTESTRLSLGAALNKNFLPPIYHSAYGADPISAKIFMEVRGMKMWEL